MVSSSSMVKPSSHWSKSMSSTSCRFPKAFQLGSLNMRPGQGCSARNPEPCSSRSAHKAATWSACQLASTSSGWLPSPSGNSADRVLGRGSFGARRRCGTQGQLAFRQPGQHALAAEAAPRVQCSRDRPGQRLGLPRKREHTCPRRWPVLPGWPACLPHGCPRSKGQRRTDPA